MCQNFDNTFFKTFTQKYAVIKKFKVNKHLKNHIITLLPCAAALQDLYVNQEVVCAI